MDFERPFEREIVFGCGYYSTVPHGVLNVAELHRKCHEGTEVVFSRGALLSHYSDGTMIDVGHLAVVMPYIGTLPAQDKHQR